MDQTGKTSAGRTELQMARSMCWHCQSEINGEYFCEKCVKVQPLSKELDYFTCFGLPRHLKIDLLALEAKFYELSRAFHPDFYQNTSESEQSISLGNAALLNTAYHTLRDPIQRAEYLLHLEAGSAKDIRTAPPADLFEEILELQENLEEFRSLSPDAEPDKHARLRARLEAERENLERRQQAMDGNLNELFLRWDILQARADATKALTPSKQAVLKDMRDLLSHRTYLRNILDDLVTTLEAGKGHETHESHRRH